MLRDETADILLVEDNPDDVELALRALRKRNIFNPVLVARDGVEALEMLLGDHNGIPPLRPKVVFLDLKLPKVSGLDVLRRLRANEETRTLPVVIVSSSKEETDVQQAYLLGANSYVVKPVEFESFVEALGSLGAYWLHLNQPPT